MPGPSNPPRGKGRKAAVTKRKKQEQSKKTNKVKGKQKEIARLPSGDSSDDDPRKRAKHGEGYASGESEDDSEEELGIYANDKV
jgi:hypothetical protein